MADGVAEGGLFEGAVEGEAAVGGRAGELDGTGGEAAGETNEGFPDGELVVELTGGEGEAFEGEVVEAPRAGDLAGELEVEARAAGVIGGTAETALGLDGRWGGEVERGDERGAGLGEEAGEVGEGE